jgi:hypothetical protein
MVRWHIRKKPSLKKCLRKDFAQSVKTTHTIARQKALAMDINLTRRNKVNKKILYNFYIDPDDKEACEKKLEELFGKQEKGQLASLIRILLKQFLATPKDKMNPLLIKAIEAEYVYSQKLNKRSKM